MYNGVMYSPDSILFLNALIGKFSTFLLIVFKDRVCNNVYMYYRMHFYIKSMHCFMR